MLSFCCRWCWTGTWSTSFCRWGSKHTHDSSGFPSWRESPGSTARWSVQHGSTGWKSGKLCPINLTNQWELAFYSRKERWCGCVLILKGMISIVRIHFVAYNLISHNHSISCLCFICAKAKRQTNEWLNNKLLKWKNWGINTALRN